MSRNIFFDDKTVMVVEDDLSVAEKITEQLTCLGFLDIHIATTLAQAKDILSRNTIDVALLDINLMGGETTLELGWSLSADAIPIVFFSGYNPQEMAQATRGYEFLEKPVSLPRLKASLHRAMLRSTSQSHAFMRKKMAGQAARQ